MAFKKGNQLWKLAPNPGRPRIFATPDDMWKAACKYFEWCDNNPLYEGKHMTDKYEGLVEVSAPRMRPYTEKGMCIHMGISLNYFRNFEENNKDNDKLADYMAVIAHIKNVIFTQKLEGAAAGLLQHNIIAMELGLAQKHQVEDDREDKVIGIKIIGNDKKKP